MERTGLAKTLAEPTLTAISGEAANFLAGGEFPVPKGSDRDGNISVEFKQFGVGLGFTPVVMSDGRISMRISTEVSELTTAGAMMTGSSIVTDEDGSSFAIAGVSIPALRVRRAETTVELPSGGSLVMAGLLQESVRQGIDGIPGAKDLPVLGALFRSRDYQSEETELVIIVTPYLVKPANEHELKTPADGFAPPNDLGAILLGRLNSVYSVSGQSSNDASWQGPVGHIVD
jgi:pilus assembly protein CpaC